MRRADGSRTDSPLAGAADVLSPQVRPHLERLLAFIEPNVAALDRLFRKQLGARGTDSRQWKALSEITPGAAATLWGQHRSLEDAAQVVDSTRSVPSASSSILVARRAMGTSVEKPLPGGRGSVSSSASVGRRPIGRGSVRSLHSGHYPACTKPPAWAGVPSVAAAGCHAPSRRFRAPRYD